jgi:hypothetical protein
MANRLSMRVFLTTQALAAVSNRRIDRKTADAAL